MISHFQWRERKNNWLNKEWYISFYFRGVHYKAIYYKDGSIQWQTQKPPSDAQEVITEQIHDLVLYHIFEDHTPPL
ncbi:hypothetical protein SAMN05192534_10743 [Alteribacillus persepolensis]|uniref:YheE family protein n=1 Tax=Alteribacillus persepolensis TaxID=568899 RepID=A0A1G8DCV6_9BACI|nr:DUF5342 family protein [Alteribacillus persepolensis]SDH55413.1 hypothetical protein SAMN05192534_10743 [Alteribacillus persepolensis]